MTTLPHFLMLKAFFPTSRAVPQCKMVTGKKKWQHKEMVFWVVIFIKQVILSHGVKRTCIIWHWLTSIHLALPQENPLMKLRRKPQGKNNPGCCSGCLFPRFYFQWYLWMGKLPGIVNRHGNRNIVIPNTGIEMNPVFFPFSLWHIRKPIPLYAHFPHSNRGDQEKKIGVDYNPPLNQKTHSWEYENIKELSFHSYKLEGKN